MANPALDAVLGTSGGSPTKSVPVSTAPSGGGNAALNAVLGTSTTGAPVSSHHGGGILGTISRIPGDFVSHVVPDVEGAIIGTGRLVKNLVAPGTHPSWGQIAHEWVTPSEWFSAKNIKADPFASQVVQLAKGIPATVEHPLRDPFQTLLLGYGAGAGLARVGLAGRAGYLDPLGKAPLGKITARAAEGGAPVTVRTLPRDPYVAARMKVVDKALKKVTKAETPVIGEFARAARSVERSAKVPYLKALADPRLATYQRALGKLGPVDRVALGTLARVPLPQDLEAWKGVLRGQDTEIAGRLAEVLSDPKLLERYGQFEKFPKIVAAHDAAKALVAANEEIGLRTGALTPETIASAPYIGTRVARGAEFVKETPARVGRLSPIHVAHAKYVAGLEKRHAHALLDARRNAAVAILGLKGRLTVAQKDAALAHLEGTGGAEGVPGLVGNKIVSAVEGPPKVETVTREVPRTPEEAVARLAELERLHNAQLDEMARMQMGEIPRNAEAGRSKQNRITQLAQMGYTAIGRRELRDRERMDAQREKVQALEKKGESSALKAARAKLAKMEADHDALYRGKNLRSPHGATGNYGRRKILPTVAEERRLAQQEQIDRILADPAVAERVPQVAAIAARMEEMASLQRALGEHNLPEFAREPGVEAHASDFGARTETTATTRPGAPGVGRLITPLGGSRAERLGNALSVARDRLEQMDRAAAARVQPTGLVGGGTPEEIAAQIAQAGRPEPVKLPDVTLQEGELGRGVGMGSGLTPPESPTRRSMGALMRTGAIDLTTDRLTPHYLASARYESKGLKHELVKQSAQAVPKGEGLPVGMVWVRTTRGESIPHLETVKLEHLSELDRIFPEGGEHPFTLSDAEARRDPALIETNPAGERLAVSQRFADGLAHQYRNEGTAVRWLFTKPLDVWRALVLNLRIPWLVNNIVGNNLLYALRFAGNGGLRAYVDMLRDVRPGFAKRLLDSPATRTLSPADVAEIFPEQTRGTFIGTQLPTGKLGRFTKPIRVLNAGLAPLDRRTEQFLRRGGVNTVLRSSPEAKAIYKSMPRQTRNWREAMIQAAKGNADLRDLTVREVNDALGDYLSLGPFERGVLRRAAPFYGWYREITRIAAHTIVDRPLRALILARLGQLESDKQQELRGAFPTFLQGSLALGAGPQGTENLLALRSANPLSTTVDLGRAAAFFANPTNRSNAEALLGLTNPYAEAAAATAFGSARSDVASPAYLGPAATALNRFGLPGSILAQVAGGLPQVQALFPPPPSRLYPTRTRQDIIERLLGDIRRQPSLQQAHYYAQQGR